MTSHDYGSGAELTADADRRASQMACAHWHAACVPPRGDGRRTGCARSLSAIRVGSGSPLATDPPSNGSHRGARPARSLAERAAQRACPP